MTNEKENIIRKYIQEEIRRVLNEKEGTSQEEINSDIDNINDILTTPQSSSVQTSVKKEIQKNPSEQFHVITPVNQSDDDGILLQKIKDDTSFSPAVSVPSSEPLPSELVSVPTEGEFEKNEWISYEKAQKNPTEYLESEWEHKSWLLTTKFYDEDVMRLHDLVVKELALSNIPDYELAYIFSVKMDCVEEFLSMGFSDLAKQMLVRILFRLRLLTSVEGLELIGQHGTSAISMSMDRQEMPRQNYDEEQQPKKSKLGLGSIVNRLKGGSK